MITERRRRLFERVSAQRQEMTVVLENVHDPHNIGAVLRSCDAVGIYEVYILYTDTRYEFERLNSLKGSSTGIRKWMRLHFFRDIDACINDVRKRYDRILATHLDSTAVSVYKTDLTERVALVFGNEHEGVSTELLSRVDGNILIPQMGMVQSLNISVACAVTIFEAMRQRLERNMYSESVDGDDQLRTEILESYIQKHEDSYKK